MTSVKPSPSTSIGRSLNESMYPLLTGIVRIGLLVHPGASYQLSAATMSSRPSLLTSATAADSAAPASICFIANRGSVCAAMPHIRAATAAALARPARRLNISDLRGRFYVRRAPQAQTTLRRRQGFGDHLPPGKKEHMRDDQPVDYYETLQISPNADPDTIQRVFRLLAQRFHPDNKETGDADRFRALHEAYSVLSVPEKRAQYDVHHQALRQERWRFAASAKGASDFELEQQTRCTVLEILYARRR